MRPVMGESLLRACVRACVRADAGCARAREATAWTASVRVFVGCAPRLFLRFGPQLESCAKPRSIAAEPRFVRQRRVGHLGRSADGLSEFQEAKRRTWGLRPDAAVGKRVSEQHEVVINGSRGRG